MPLRLLCVTRTASTRPLLTTTQSGGGAAWGMFWGLLFGILFFVPILGIAMGAGFGALFGKIQESGISKEFISQVRGQLKPGTSALFMVVEKVTPDKAIAALSKLRRYSHQELTVQGDRAEDPRGFARQLRP